LGKPSGADLQLGLATCPALYAWEEHPEMGNLIQRQFEKQGDIELVRTSTIYQRITITELIRIQARDYVTRSSALQRSRALAQTYANKAREMLTQLPESEAKTALEVLTEVVIGRKK
jgi:hexaprenyl-diphosphate synthase